MEPSLDTYWVGHKTKPSDYFEKLTKFLLAFVAAVFLNVAAADVIILGPIPQGTGRPVVTIANNTDGPVSFLIGSTQYTIAARTASNYSGDQGAQTAQIEFASMKGPNRIDKSYALENGKHYSLEWTADDILDIYLVLGPFGR